jgi:hypothetical protein
MFVGKKTVQVAGRAAACRVGCMLVMLCQIMLLHILAPPPIAGIAQLVEHLIRNEGVGCSSHPVGTISISFQPAGLDQGQSVCDCRVVNLSKI